jgi:hypothetical protein
VIFVSNGDLKRDGRDGAKNCSLMTDFLMRIGGKLWNDCNNLAKT